VAHETEKKSEASISFREDTNRGGACMEQIFKLSCQPPWFVAHETEKETPPPPRFVTHETEKETQTSKPQILVIFYHGALNP